jgi:hypothetical protein
MDMRIPAASASLYVLNVIWGGVEPPAIRAVHCGSLDSFNAYLLHRNIVTQKARIVKRALQERAVYTDTQGLACAADPDGDSPKVTPL